MKAHAPNLRVLVLCAPLFVGATSLCLMDGRAIAADDAPTPDEVQLLVEQLGSDRAAERRVAEDRLLEFGATVLPLLPEPRDVADAAIRDAVERIRRELERRAAVAATTASRVTFSGTAKPPELLEILARQTGNELEWLADASEPAERVISVDWKETEFWQAVKELCRTAGCGIAPAASGRTLQFVPAEDESASSTGLDRASAEPGSAFLVRLLESSVGPANAATGGASLLRMRWQVMAEPRLRPVFLSLRDANVGVTTGGRELPPFNPLSAREIEFATSSAVVVDVVYGPFQGPSPIDVQVSGDFDVEMIATSVDLRFTGLDRPPIVRRRGGVTATLDSFNPAAVEAKLTIRYASGGPLFESFRLSALAREFRLELPDGRKLSPVGDVELTREEDGALGLSCRFEKLPDEWREASLIARLPASLVRVPVKFEWNGRLDNGAGQAR